MRLPLPRRRSRSVPADGRARLSSSSPPPPPPSPGAPSPHLSSSPLTSSPTETSPSLPAFPSTRRSRQERPSPPCPSPKLLSPSHALPSTALGAIAAALPARHRGKDLSLVYSTARDGASLRTFYAAAAASCAEGDPIIIVVRDGGGSVFGAYLSRGDCRAPAGAKFFGGGECFVFTAAPEVAVYRWGRGNNFFQLAGKEAMSVGGGQGFALMLDGSLENGSSSQCDTFESPCLASSEAFECVVFEAWALVTSTARSK